MEKEFLIFVLDFSDIPLRQSSCLLGLVLNKEQGGNKGKSCGWEGGSKLLLGSLRISFISKVDEVHTELLLTGGR